ncbi:hypothetical protein [Chryseobacterium fistulae]|uniref:Uncharacterized protein n=1 Tax=Chryseobacterium fistulae TaxID=2675058 RepID=A0A6N4XRS9_9FLAO|nr:hypothetical protein [Chryseobacterium fistulae]CAA7386856.1 hypothetical protein CHRY9393_01157 [Chryseobacterium fistulae]
MKNFFNITLLLFVATLLFSCRNGNDDIPEDIHEHEEIEQLVVTLTNKNDATDIQTIKYIGGLADGHIHAHAGDVYDVSLDFQVKHDDHYHSVNDEILEEKNEHFITYNFAGADIKVKRADNDVVRSDGKKLGLKTEWTVASTTSTGKVNIKLIHGPSSVNDNSPSADNQLGSVVGGESDVDALIDIH